MRHEREWVVVVQWAPPPNKPRFSIKTISIYLSINHPSSVGKNHHQLQSAMEIQLSSLAFLLSLLPFLFMLLKLAAKTTLSKNKTIQPTLKPRKKLLPPGPRKLPFIGNLHLLASGRLPHHTLHDLSQKYGPVMQLQLGEIPTVVISSPEAAKQAMRTHDVILANRPSSLSADIIFYGTTDIAFSPYGEYWRQMRKFATLELLSVKRVQSTWKIREAELLNFCRWVGSNQGRPINLAEKILSMNYDIVSRSSFGKKTEEHDMFASALAEVVELFAGFNLTDFYPSIKWVEWVGGFKTRLERVHEKSDNILETIIKQRKEANRKKYERDEDLLDVLLKLHDSHDLDLPLTMDSVKSVMLELFFAGSETTSTTTDWAMSELLKNPEILSKAQQEVRRVFDEKNGRIEESCFDELKYLKLVIKEALRIHPPAPLLLPRECRESCQILGYHIPSKTRVMINAWAIGRDPKHWKDPERFVPERFADTSVDFKGNDFRYIPFGAGRRICPGLSYGVANVESQLAMLLYYFDWSLPEGMKPGEIDMTESFGVTNRRKNKLCVIANVVRPLPVDG